MKEKEWPPRLLSLNVRASRLGYAVFEGPRRLLDWGTRSDVSGSRKRPRDGRHRVAVLFEGCDPSVVVLNPVLGVQEANCRKIQETVGFIRTEALRRSIPVQPIHASEVRRALRIFNAHNKSEAAAAIAGIFPELFWRLPPRRRQWETEPRAMMIFDAIAAGFAYWKTFGCGIPGQEHPAVPDST